MRFFLSGVIQGSLSGTGINDQSYRDELKALLRVAFPAPAHTLGCPIEMHPGAMNYTFEQGKAAFEQLVNEAATADAIIAFFPTASNGTAIEIWEAAKRGTPIFTISPMTENWVIKFYSTRVFPTIAEFATFVQSGELETFMDNYLARKIEQRTGEYPTSFELDQAERAVDIVDAQIQDDAPLVGSKEGA